MVARKSGDIDLLHLYVLKISGADGTIMWTRTRTTARTSDVLHGVDIDAVGDVYVAGGEDVQNLQGLSRRLLS